ncbi:MAG: hypothetical protein OXT74_05315 [Candidatus Poribacteria bacterium]|nr:hypothetical protein [Candidatus Poribacteria bacterium]
MGIGEHGAEVKVIGEGGSGTGGVVMRLDTHGGKVSVYGKGISAGQAYMGVDEHGGVVRVYGNGSQTSRAVIGVNKYGNGAVTTWDKNGYLQR